jgi:endonuclease/exonuclease/phosphatase family metal-dependent hydrolase
MPRPVVAGDRDTPGEGAVTTSRMATWNLRHGRGQCRARVDLGAAAAMIAALDCDVVAIQEVDRGQPRSGCADQIAELALRLGWHGLFAPSILGRPRAALFASEDVADDGGPAYGIGLLSRHPLRESARIVLPSGSTGQGPVADREPRVLLGAAVTTAIGDVHVRATHLSWVPWLAWRQLHWVLGQPRDAQEPTVIAGDLNLPAWAVDAALAGTEWRAASAGPTFPARTPCVQLDHILVRHARLTDVRVGRVGPSDHRLLSASVEAANRGEVG